MSCLVRSQACLVSDAHGDILRGLQVVEHATSAPSLLLGEKIEGESRLVEILSILSP